MQNPFKDIDWTSMITTPEYYSWCGLSYERVFFLHLNQVKKKLGINGMAVSAYCWFSNNRKLEEGESGAQIDLLLDRADGIINIVEVKWSEEDKKYVMTGEDQQSLSNKRNVLVSQTGMKKGIHFTLVTVSGYVVNRYSDMIQSCVTLDDLFSEMMSVFSLGRGQIFTSRQESSRAPRFPSGECRTRDSFPVTRSIFRRLCS